MSVFVDPVEVFKDASSHEAVREFIRLLPRVVNGDVGTFTLALPPLTTLNLLPVSFFEELFARQGLNRHLLTLLLKEEICQI